MKDERPASPAPLWILGALSLALWLVLVGLAAALAWVTGCGV